MDYVITFSDVMAGVITLALGLVTYFIKRWFADMEEDNADIRKSVRDGNREIQERIEQNDRIINERINKLEQKTNNDIANIKEEVSSLKADMPTIFVLREDFFRSMNRVEDSMKGIDGKIDQLLLRDVKKE